MRSRDADGQDLPGFHKVAEPSGDREGLDGEMAKDGQAVADDADAIKRSVAEDQAKGLEEMHPSSAVRRP